MLPLVCSLMFCFGVNYLSGLWHGCLYIYSVYHVPCTEFFSDQNLTYDNNFHYREKDMGCSTTITNTNNGNKLYECVKMSWRKWWWYMSAWCQELIMEWLSWYSVAIQDVNKTHTERQKGIIISACHHRFNSHEENITTGWLPLFAQRWFGWVYRDKIKENDSKGRPPIKWICRVNEKWRVSIRGIESVTGKSA